MTFECGSHEDRVGRASLSGQEFFERSYDKRASGSFTGVCITVLAWRRRVLHFSHSTRKSSLSSGFCKKFIWSAQLAYSRHFTILAAPFMRATLCSLWLFIALSCISPLVSGATSEGPKSYDLHGVWIKSTVDHDFYIETGVVVAEYPLIVIEEGLRFSVHRFGVTCDSDGTTKSNADFNNEYRLRCNLPLSQNESDLLNALSIHVSSGEITINKDSTYNFRLDSNERLNELISASNHYVPMIDGVPFQYSHISTLTSSPVILQISGSSLIVESASSGRRIEFSRVHIDDLIDAGAITYILGLANGRYFRCIMNVFSAQRSGRKHPHEAELSSLRKLSRRLSLLGSEKDADLRGGDSSRHESRLKRREELNATMGLMWEELAKSPAVDAVDNGAFGRYLGCHDRDGDIHPRLSFQEQRRNLQ